MMAIMWTISLSRQAAHFLDSLEGKQRKRLEAALTILSLDPREGKPLKGELREYWSFRVAIYRIIYTIRDEGVSVAVVRIQHRKEVYERLRR